MDEGVEDGVLALEGGVVLMFSSCGTFPFSKGLSLSLNNLTPFFAFLNNTDVRRPTPPVVGREGGLRSGRPLATAWHSLCKPGGGVDCRSCALVQSLSSAAPSSSSSSFRRLQGQAEDWGSLVIGRRVGGSRGASPWRGGGAGPVGSSVGGEVDLRSSVRRGESK